MKRKRTAAVLAALIIVLAIWIWWGNGALTVSRYEVKNSKIPAAFSGYKIAHISDLHNAELGADNKKLIDALSEINPDIIVITGDIADSRHTDIDISINFVKQAAEIAPVYYVTGNHESRISECGVLEEGIAAAGGTVLRGKTAELEKDGQKIVLAGVDDPSFAGEFAVENGDIMSLQLENLGLNDEAYTILLSHRPELFDTYIKAGVDLVFSGHAHGGQVKLPFIGGIVAPGQGLFPRYDGGLYSEERTDMIISRGIGNSLFPFRVNNRPEIAVAILQND